VTLIGQPAWVAPEGSAVLGLHLSGPTDDLTIRVTVHRAVTSRSSFQQAITGKALGGVEGRSTVAVDSLPDDGNGRRVLTVSVQASGTPLADETRLLPGRSGVYPLRIELRRRGEGTVDSFVTPLAVLAPGVIPLSVAWLWPLDVTPAHRPDGGVRGAAAKAFAPNGRLGRMVEAAATMPYGPLTLVPTPETLEAWPDGKSATPLREVAAQDTRQILGGPYVPTDVPAALAEGLAQEVDNQFTRGGQTLERVLGRPVPATTLLAGPLDPAALARLGRYGVERLVVTSGALEPLEQRLTPSHPFTLATAGGPDKAKSSARPKTSSVSFPAAVADPELARLLSGDAAPALRAARFMSALSLVALEAPRAQRGVVVAMRPGWDPPATLLSAVLHGFQMHPALRAATLDELFETVLPETRSNRPLVRTLSTEERSDADLALSPQRVRTTRLRLNAFRQLVGNEAVTPGAGDRALLVSQADDLGPAVAGQYLSAVDRLIRGVTDQVRGPRQRITLTARRATIPISLLNPTSEPLQVRVRLESDQLRFPEGAERELTLPPQNTTERFVIEARSSGAFPLSVVVTSPDGQLLVSETELTVRSTVVSGVGAMLTASAGVFLLVWWANHLRRARRNGDRPARRRRHGRGPEATTGEAPAAAPAPIRARSQAG
jgi:hypothetical protein